MRDEDFIRLIQKTTKPHFEVNDISKEKALETRKTITTKEHWDATNCTPWFNLHQFELYEVQEFLNRKGYDIIIHRAEARVQPTESVPCTGTVQNVGPEVDMMVSRVLAVKPEVKLPTIFTDDVMEAMGLNAVFQRELKKNLLK